MTVLEQKIMELVPGALLRIAEALEGIDEKLELLTQQRQEPARQELPAEDQEQDDVPEANVKISEVKDAVSSIRLHNWQTKQAITFALFFRHQYVTKDCASHLSRLYGGVSVKQTQEAIENGEIEAVLPEMEDKEINHWNKKLGKFEKIMTRRPVGRYQVSLRSTILWLESHGRRGVSCENPIYKCIEKIINT